MSGRLVPTNGIELWVEDDRPEGGSEHGADGESAIVLLGGADATALRWPGALVDALVAAGHRVVRVEHRDSGRSTKIDPDRPYRLEDMAHDVAGVLAALGTGPVDLVGYSMGGAVAQLLALQQPDLVRSLVLIATTPGAGDDRLPAPDDEFVAQMAERLFAPPPASRAERIEWTTDLYRLLAGVRYPFDEDAQRALAAAELDIGWYPESGHGIATNASPSRLDRLDAIRAPALVVHGDRDVVYAIEHAESLATGIPDATLVVVEGLGHEVPAAFGSELASLVLAHVSSG
jgi:pimeloyl-ACP methyl ester carboxylesterase